MNGPRRDEARRLRVDPGLSLGQLMKHFGVGSATLTDWLRGIEPPEWTRRPNAKDGLRVQALELRAQGWSVNDLTPSSVSHRGAGHGSRRGRRAFGAGPVGPRRGHLLV